MKQGARHPVSRLAPRQGGAALVVVAFRGIETIHVRHGRLGRGVFASRDLRAGVVVEVCPTLEIPDEDVSGMLADYVFGADSAEDRSVLFLGYGMLYNHSADPNLTYRQEGPDAVAFVTTRAVAAGEELTIDYGAEWWEERGLTPE